MSSALRELQSSSRERGHPCPPKRARARLAVRRYPSTLSGGASLLSRSRAHGGQGCPRSRLKRAHSSGREFLILYPRTHSSSIQGVSFHLDTPDNSTPTVTQEKETAGRRT